MSKYGDMYRKMAAEKRKEAERYEQDAVRIEEIERQEKEAHTLVKNTPPDIRKAAYKLYNKKPLKTMRSDDSYSRWEDTVAWHELSFKQQAEYINKVYE